MKQISQSKRYQPQFKTLVQKPASEDAYQWFPWLRTMPNVTVLEGVPYADTFFGPQRVLPGTWIIRTQNGAVYIKDPEIVDQDYYVIEEKEDDSEPQ